MKAFRFSRLVTLAVLVAMVIALAPAFSTVDAAGGVMAYGETVSGQITDKSYFELWEFEGSKGDRVQILMEGSDGLDPYVGLLDAFTEQVLAEDDDSAGNSNAQIDFALPMDGLYLIVATRYDLDTGTSQGGYDLSLKSSNTSQSTSNTTTTSASSTTEPVEIEPGVFYIADLVLDEAVGNSLDNDSFAHLYGLEAEAGTEVVIVMLANESDLDTYVIVLTEDGDVLAEDDDSGADIGAGKMDSFVALTLPETGLYYVIASRSGLDEGKSTGAYALIAGIPEEEGPVEPVSSDESSDDDLPPGMESFGMIEVGTTPNETISDESFFHLFGFEGQAGDEITVTMRGEDGLDAYVALLDPSDEVLVEDDDSAGGMDAQITIKLPESGLYIIVATRNGLEEGTTVGSYTLELTAGPPETAAEDTGIPSFTGLPGRALMDDSGATVYLSGNGWSDNPAKNTPVENFAGSDLPGRGAGLNVPRPLNFSLNFEEIKVTFK